LHNEKVSIVCIVSTGLITGLIIGLVIGLVMGVVIGVVNGLVIGLVIGVVIGVVTVLDSGTINFLYILNIQCLYNIY
jgi:hypothetical protein